MNDPPPPSSPPLGADSSRQADPSAILHTAPLPTSTHPIPPPHNAPPPVYTASHPQILVTPLPDSLSFFWGRTVQGEVFVKGLGEGSGHRGVSQLSVQLSLSDRLPHQPPRTIHEFAPEILYPPRSLAQSTSSPPTDPFSTSHRFNIPFPPDPPLPGTLNLTTHGRGQVVWSLDIKLLLISGETVVESVPVEGTPQQVDLTSDIQGVQDDEILVEEVEQVLERDGVRCRMLLDDSKPRLGSVLRLGLEIRPMERQKTAVAGLSSQPNPANTLRPLRRVRVELFRRVRLSQASSTEPSASKSSSSSPREEDGDDEDGDGNQHLSLLYTSGKSLRYPGNASVHPPLRVLFTIPTAQLGSVVDQTWGEITQTTPYHSVTFFIRATIGFGNPQDQSPTSDARPWTLERQITIRPKMWKEPRQVVIQRGEAPALGDVESNGPEVNGVMTDEELAREAYRLKGMDTVGQGGTVRMDETTVEDLPPPFDGAAGAGPSGTTPNEHGGTSSAGDRVESASGGLPTFLESEAQMRTGEAPLPSAVVPSERLVPVNFEDDPEFDRATSIGRRESLGGELGTWVEYDGYETFSVAPPSMSASFGVGGSMDPPQEGDDDVNVVEGMMGRLGLDGAHQGTTGQELIEQLGLGEGTRVVDLQDDLPPGIDEPSLPALPGFATTRHAPPPHFASPPRPHPDILPHPHAHPHIHTHPHPHDHRHVAPRRDQPPPSFAASEAAVAHRRASQSAGSQEHVRVTTISTVVGGGGGDGAGSVGAGGPGGVDGGNGASSAAVVEGAGDAPPGYFGTTTSQGGGPPAYS